MNINLVVAILGIIVPTIGIILGSLLVIRQLQEQKKQREFEEQVHKEAKKLKVGLYTLNANQNPKPSPNRWKDK